MRRLVPALLASAVVATLSVGVVVWAGSGGRSAAHRFVPAGTPAVATVHIVRFLPRGATSFCELDTCGIGLSPPVSISLPAGALHYRATITFSFRYRTVGTGRFSVAADLRLPSGFHVATAPSGRRLLPTDGRLQSTTLVYRPRELGHAVTYTLNALPQIRRSGSGRVALHLTQLLVSVEAWPA
jgi:hypothetical protein